MMRALIYIPSLAAVLCGQPGAGLMWVMAVVMFHTRIVTYPKDRG